jgi:antitoxin (DNA-binding transcriptional repressor) of toxin-antitoxin stability system
MTALTFSRRLAKLVRKEQPMITVKIHEAKTNLSKLLAAVEKGENVIIKRGNKVIAKITVANDDDVKPKRQLGLLEGKFELPDSFFDPLPDDELEAWGMI